MTSFGHFVRAFIIGSTVVATLTGCGIDEVALSDPTPAELCDLIQLSAIQDAVEGAKEVERSGFDTRCLVRTWGDGPLTGTQITIWPLTADFDTTVDERRADSLVESVDVLESMGTDRAAIVRFSFSKGHVIATDGSLVWEVEVNRDNDIDRPEPAETANEDALRIIEYLRERFRAD